MSALGSSASKDDIRLERKKLYEFAKIKANGQLRSLYRTQYEKPVAGPTTTVSTVQTVAGQTVLVSGPYTPLLVEIALRRKLTCSATLKTSPAYG